MKRLLVLFSVLVITGAVALETCPDRSAHRKAIVAVINDGYREGIDVPEENEEAVERIIGTVGTRMTSRVVGSQLVFHGHSVYSTGGLAFIEDESRVVSVGFFGHVFVFRSKVLRNAFPKSFGLFE